MENNFYVGIVCHFKKLSKYTWQEKVVLYSEDNLNYIDLNSFMSYPIEGSSRKREDYVLRNSLFKTDISDYQVDYMYLLNKYNESKKRNIVKKYTPKN